MPATLDLSTLPEPMRIVVERLLSASQSEQHRLEQENKLLKEHIRLLLLSKYGAKSEKLSDAQFNLLEAEPGVSREEVANEAAQPKREKLLKPRAAHGRAPLPRICRAWRKSCACRTMSGIARHAVLPNAASAMTWPRCST